MMPRLSETLTGPRSIDTCQCCGFIPLPAQEPLTRWLEHGEDDAPDPHPIVVVLCKPCSDKLIEPHPRLYRALQLHEPLLGAMPICQDCTHREATRCKCPAAKINGGEGLQITFTTPPTRIHVCRSPRSQSGYTVNYTGPVNQCSGKEPR